MRRIMTGQVPQSREFPIPGFFLGAGTGIGKIWFRKKCELPEISFFGGGTEKSIRTGNQKNLVPKIRTGTGEIWVVRNEAL